MKGQLAGVATEYEQGLADYLRLRSETQLTEAARLGRLAMGESLGVLDMIMIHHTALARLLHTQKDGSPDDVLRASALFLCETLSSFEMAQRGFQDVSEAIMRMVQFALVVCHELRSPLTSIVTSLGMLNEIQNASPSSNEGMLISNALKSSAILKTRTDDLQDLVSYRAGILSLRRIPVEVGPLLTGIVNRAEPQARRVGVEIRLEVAERLPRLSADPNRLEQIVSNLITNALKYAAEGRRLDVRAFTREGAMVIEVRDYGKGMDPSARSRLFDPSPRRDEATGERAGMGIGLALCNELVAQHGGRMVISSEEGKGSLFTVELPLSRRTLSHEGSDH
ncbi:MAG: HAMP domain-containing sensor histidine kinase [Spirochaetia bacterium]|jgi:signal transduction histidine kinase